MDDAPNKDQRPVILYTDDDAGALLMAESALMAAGFDVIMANDGEESVTMFEKHLPDLVIMDALMPRVDGFEAIRRIRQIPEGRHVPIMMVTGLDDHDSIATAYEGGATDFLTKPINFHILPHRVQYILRSSLISDELRTSQERLNTAQRIARIGSWEVEYKTGRVLLSEVCKSLLGFSDGDQVETVDQAFAHIDTSVSRKMIDGYRESMSSEQTFSMEFNSFHPQMGVELTLRIEAESLSQVGQQMKVIGTLQDVTEISNAQKQIHDLAYYDVVTGLPNRAFLNERLAYALALAKRSDTKFALLFLDLDHFKQVNDTLGHDAGDELLHETGVRLNNAVRDYDAVVRPFNNKGEGSSLSDHHHTVARLGGDEFIVLVTNIKDEQDAAIVAKRISSLINEPYYIHGTEANVSTTIGISLYPNDGDDVETLLKHADIAMYHAKENGRNGMQFYSRQIHDASQERFALEQKLKSAIENEALDIVYQPKFDLKTGQMVGAEALVRWYDPDLGAISPAEFIPLAEDTGLIMPLGRWVMIEACKQMKAWADEGLPLSSVAINCSTVQFVRSDMTGLVSEAIALSGLEPGFLEIELTESLLLQDTEQGIRILNELKSRGIQVSIDDFGTGFSSLSYLKKLPVDKLKIDHSFVRDLTTDSGDQAIVSAIITLSHRLQLEVVAEGVETELQAQMLADMGCDQIQGYYISQPLNAADFRDWLATQDQSTLIEFPRLAS